MISGVIVLDNPSLLSTTARGPKGKYLESLLETPVEYSVVRHEATAKRLFEGSSCGV